MVDKMPLMKCGHRAQGYRTDVQPQIPACVICAGITPDAYITVEEPDLSERTARCSYHKMCSSEQPSSGNLAFFTYRPDKDYDEYYCSCRGWD